MLGVPDVVALPGVECHPHRPAPSTNTSAPPGPTIAPELLRTGPPTLVQGPSGVAHVAAPTA